MCLYCQICCMTRVSCNIFRRVNAFRLTYRKVCILHMQDLGKIFGTLFFFCFVLMQCVCSKYSDSSFCWHSVTQIKFFKWTVWSEIALSGKCLIKHELRWTLSKISINNRLQCPNIFGWMHPDILHISWDNKRWLILRSLYSFDGRKTTEQPR